MALRPAWWHLHSPAKALIWLTATYAFCASWVIGFVVIFVPAGLGVREWSLTAILENTLGLAAGPAALVAVVTRLGIVVAELILLVVGLGLYSADLVARTQGW